MAVPQALVRLQKTEAYAAWKASGYALSELDEWCDESSAKYERTPEKLKAWIADSAANELSHAKLEAATDAQKVARMVGASLRKAFQVDVESLAAVKVKILVDRNGQERGRVETPDWEARGNASKEIKKVFGAYAAEKLEVLAGPLDEYAALTDEQLKREIAKYRKGAGVETPEGIDGEKSGEGLPVLVAERDDDRRSTERSAEQAFPGPALLSANHRRTQ